MNNAVSRSTDAASTSPWSRYALVLVDMQRDFWSAAATTTAPDLPDRVAALLEYARAEGLTVVHVRPGSDRTAAIGCALPAAQLDPCIDGTPGVETLPFAAELPGEPVVTKQTFDGFLGTDLDRCWPGADPGPAGRRFGDLHVRAVHGVDGDTTRVPGVDRVGLLLGPAEAHHATLATYPFVFDTVLSHQIAERRDGWDADLDRMHTLAT